MFSFLHTLQHFCEVIFSFLHTEQHFWHFENTYVTPRFVIFCESVLKSASQKLSHVLYFLERLLKSASQTMSASQKTKDLARSRYSMFFFKISIGENAKKGFRSVGMRKKWLNEQAQMEAKLSRFLKMDFAR